MCVCAFERSGVCVNVIRGKVCFRAEKRECWNKDVLFSALHCNFYSVINTNESWDCVRPQIRKSHHFRIWNHLSPNWKLQMDRWMSGERQRCVCVSICVCVCVCYRALQTVQEVSFVFVRSEWLICLSFSFPICPSRFDTYVTLPRLTPPSVIRPNPHSCWPLTSPSNRLSVTHLIARSRLPRT